eukprot:1377532-Pleurochrysis_carterae.AAC.7
MRCGKSLQQEKGGALSITPKRLPLASLCLRRRAICEKQRVSVEGALARDVDCARLARGRDAVAHRAVVQLRTP